MTIERTSIDNSEVGEFINRAFTDYAEKKDVSLNFEEYCFAAESEDGRIIGVITGRAYYNEVHIGDLIVDEEYRGCNIGSELVKAVEMNFKNRGYEKITLTTFGFQVPF